MCACVCAHVCGRHGVVFSVWCICSVCAPLVCVCVVCHTCDLCGVCVTCDLCGMCGVCRYDMVVYVVCMPSICFIWIK